MLFIKKGVCCLGGLILLLAACGTDENSNSNVKKTGSYQAQLVFPPDIPRLEYSVKELTGIDCEAAEIEYIKFIFQYTDETMHVPPLFECSLGYAQIDNIPIGTDIFVVALAQNFDGVTMLRGYEETDISPNTVTRGGTILMDRVDDDGDSFYLPEDCKDDDPNIYPGAEEIPGNGIDEDCDGIDSDPPPDSFVIEELNLDMEFARIPAGEFTMGSPETELGRNTDEVQHQVIITKDFYMQTTEVTQRQWRLIAEQSDDTNLNTIISPSFFSECGDDCPVESVSSYDVQRFIATMNTIFADQYECRLPTEAEWEYAARGGHSTAFANGPITIAECEYDVVLDSMGWYCYNSEVDYEGCVDLSENGGPTCAGTHAVADGSKESNDYGLYDMHGNVYEWCSDWYDDYPSEPVNDPKGPSAGNNRVVRGGGYNELSRYCRSADRYNVSPDNRYRNVGFRLVCSQIRN